ncbi:SH3 domain-containing protein [Aquimarina sediminis]|uniref:SH3 domain-containing protein n=1 Tax=Aquimarina sediminis TaxID=2070536 RepID=UPI000FFF4669|nr:SH3 domain-containing protein [Aquimarina sediminis]
MKKIHCCILVLLLVFTNVMSQHFDKNTVLTKGTTYYMFGDNVKLREAPGLDSKTLVLLPIGSEIKILDMMEISHMYNGISSPWYKVSFENQIGYLVGGLISIYRHASHKDSNTNFLCNLSEKDERVFVNIRATSKGKVIDEVSVRLIGNGSFQFKNIGHRGVKQLHDILFVDNDSESCGVNGGKSYVFWDGTTLRHVANTSEIGDGGLYHHHSEYIFPEDKDGRENVVIYKEEHGELKDEETEWYVTTKQERNLTWDGEKFLPVNYREE